MEISSILSAIKTTPTEITIFVTTIIAIITIWLKSREVDLNSVTSISRLQSEQMKALMEQNAQLSRDIGELRKLTTEQYEVIKELRNRIFELEEMIARTDSITFSVLRRDDEIE